MIHIPASLKHTLEQHFIGKFFVIYDVLKFAEPEEIQAWRTALNMLTETGSMIRVLGVMYIKSLPGDAE